MTIPDVVLGDVAVSEQDDKTRIRLIRAAVQVFDKKGYGAASVREIVELAGVSKPALYYHFGSKEGVLKAILQEAAHEVEATSLRGVARQGTARDRITALCEDFYAMFGRNLSVVRVTHAVFLGPTDVAPDFDFQIFERTLGAALEQIVREGQASGEVTTANPADVALAVLGIVGAIFGRQLHPRVEPIGVEGLRRLLNLVFDGVLREGSNAHAAGEQRQ